MDILDGGVESGGHEFVHLLRLVPFHKVRRPATAPQELLQFLMLDAGEYGWITDLVPVQVQNWQHRAVRFRIQEFVGMPRGSQRRRFCLAVANDAGDDQIGIVECGTKGMAQRITQLAAFVNRSRRRRRNMAGDPSGKGELLEQLFQAGFVLRDVRINLTPCTFQVDIAHNRRASVTGACDVEHIQVVLPDDAVQMNIDEVLAWRCAPMGDHQRLHVLQLQRLLQQRIVIEVDLAHRHIVGSAPVSVHLAQQLWSERMGVLNGLFFA